MSLASFSSRFARSAMVCSVDGLASEAGVAALGEGGTAADAAVAASAVLAVTTQHMCGIGGDLFALVLPPGAAEPAALNASGRAGSGADPARLRREGHQVMPPAGDIRSVPVPGCVDGWVEVHRRFGRLPLGRVLHAAIDYAEQGFPASPLLARAAPAIASLPGGADFRAATRPGAVVRRPGVARALRSLVEGGRDAFYLGEFGQGLIRLGRGEFSEDDLRRPSADWATALGMGAWGATLWTTPPNSQGYLTVASASIADSAGLPADPDDPLWAHITVEASRLAAYDRVAVLHENSSGTELLSPDRLDPRRHAIDPARALALGGAYRGGGTAYLCAVDEERMGVSMIQSNASGFGAGIVEPVTGISLHNRGIGFNLLEGHPAEYGPGRRPPHTLSPALITAPDGSLRAVIGTMGGDAQPQVLLQLLARMLHSGEDVGRMIAAPRWVLANPEIPGGFSTWVGPGPPSVRIEPAGRGWVAGLEARGHVAEVALGNYGHAHAIVCHGDHLEGAADPRCLTGDAIGY